MTNITNTVAEDSRGRTGYSVCAIITTYAPDEKLHQLVADAAGQVDRVFLIDDSGSRDVRNSLDKELCSIKKLTMHHMTVNSGIAAALNCGLKAASSEGYEKALLLDDDTRIAPSLVRNLERAWRQMECNGHNPGVIGVSRSDDFKKVSRKREATNGIRWHPVRGVVTAGSMVDIGITCETGGFREEFIIDAVDYDYCSRLRRNGMLVARLDEALMVQPVGETKTIKVLGLGISTTNHSPLRRYYMFRNNVVLATEQFRYDPLLSIAIVWFLVKTLAKVICMEKHRTRKLKAMVHGTLDGVRRRMGHAQLCF